MEWTGLNELREMFLAFFESKGHLRHESASLVPQGDASLLLINSGMAPLKKYFTGELTPPRVRMATCQKCIRTVDIENVGVTDRHGSYFEMLGNFSFGEYFKREAIAWAWEFFTQVLGMDPEKLYPTVFLEDDEAWDIWVKEVGVAESHLSRLGREDNFWEHGKGPCGPSSEIYYDRGAQHGCGSPDCKPGCDCDRYMEVWNLVFTQFDSDGQGNYTPLASKNIDTGMAAERLACVIQGVGNLFEVDTVRSILRHISEISGVAYHADAKQDISLRIVTDHIRATTMMIGDGVMPGNEGRGYVLRRLLRRAARHGRLLGVTGPFLSEVAQTVIKENQNAYPSLLEKREFILRVIATEEENFGRTIDTGMNLLEKMIADCGGHILSGKDAFSLSDTYGFPIDLTKEIAAEHGIKVDEEGFKRLALEQRERSRAARKEASGWDDQEAGIRNQESGERLPATEFVGYETDQCEATILAVFDNIIVLDKTPFYAESGGQCGDIGTFSRVELNADNSLREDSYIVQVTGTSKTADGVILHHCENTGCLEAGDVTWANALSRREITANHTAAHLLHAALRQCLGDHVQQAGQSVTAEHMRFDFTHFEPIDPDELGGIQYMVNAMIREANPVTTEVLPVEEARARGAIALFGEKYGDTVRVVSVKHPKASRATSMELCGGTHVRNTGELGMFTITSESSVASGVRRIEAVTGIPAYYRYVAKLALLEDTAKALKANNVNELETRAQAVMAQLKEAEKNLAAAQQKLSGYAVQELLQSAKQIGNVRFVSGELQSAESLRQACDIAKQSGEDIVALFAAKTSKGTLQFAAAAAPQATKAGAHAGNLVKAAAQAADGAGGGKPDSAMAGGKDPAKLAEALAAGRAALRQMINEK